MENVQKYNQQLIPCTDRGQVLTESKQSFETFLKVFSDCGGRVNDTTIRLMKRSIDSNEYTASDLEEAIQICYQKEEYFSWANVVKYIGGEKSLQDQLEGMMIT